MDDALKTEIDNLRENNVSCVFYVNTSFLQSNKKKIVYHREDGPALIFLWRDNLPVVELEWHISGRKLTEKEFKDRGKDNG